MPAYSRLLDIQSELGELSKEYLKSTNYGENSFSATEDFEFEFADVLYSVISLGLELNINIKESIDKVLDKYQQRLDKNNNIESGR